MARRYDSQEVRRRTISAGIKLFIEKGYHKTTVSDICRLADDSNGSFFNVFRTKNGLLMELVVNMFNGQFDAADSLLPADSEPHMLYVFETAIQLAIAETRVADFAGSVPLATTHLDSFSPRGRARLRVPNRHRPTSAEAVRMDPRGRRIERPRR